VPNGNPTPIEIATTENITTRLLVTALIKWLSGIHSN